MAAAVRAVPWSSLHFTRIFNLGTKSGEKRLGEPPRKVPQTSLYAVSPVSLPAGHGNACDSRLAHALPIGKSAIQPVWKPAVRWQCADAPGCFCRGLWLKYPLWFYVPYFRFIPPFLSSLFPNSHLTTQRLMRSWLSSSGEPARVLKAYAIRRPCPPSWPQ